MFRFKTPTKQRSDQKQNNSDLKKGMLQENRSKEKLKYFISLRLWSVKLNDRVFFATNAKKAVVSYRSITSFTLIQSNTSWSPSMGHFLLMVCNIDRNLVMSFEIIHSPAYENN